MTVHIRPAIVVLVLLSAVTGLAYPALVTVIAQVVFPTQANGSLIVRNGKVMGSRLIGQPFDDPRYFWGRPSATGPFPYNAASSSGSNLGPTNLDLTTAVAQRVETLRAADPGNTASVPVDLVTASGSGLDPHISPAGALYQIGRVARARNVDQASVRRLVEQHTEGRPLGLLGEPRINALTLNLALDAERSTKAR
jgi:potassium-transporting ATPase KdpC subunit